MKDGSEGNWEDRGVFQHISSYCDRKEKTQNGTSKIPRQVGKINYGWLPPFAWKDLLLWTFLWVWVDSFLVLDMIYVTGIPPGDRGLQWAVENTGTLLWFRNNFLPVLGANWEVFELRPICQWECGIPRGHNFIFKEERKSWKRRATSFGLHQPNSLRNVFESKTLNKGLKKRWREWREKYCIWY